MSRPILPRLFGLACALMVSACATPTTRHAVMPADLGVRATGSDLRASLAQPGVVAFQRVTFARWTSGRGAFIDRDDPRTASVPKGDEEAIIYAYVLDHPQRGRVLIDSGVSTALHSRLNGLMRRAIGDLDIHIDQTTGQWLSRETAPSAVFLTHLHSDHAGGLIDLPLATAVYAGRGEAREMSWTNRLLGRPADAMLKGRGPLREWAFQPDPSGDFGGVLDVFGDGSVWAISVPGHSAGSTAYLVNARDGPKLVVGDAVSTRLGWEQQMPQPVPGAARAAAEGSADRLRAFAKAHPAIEVFLGHQPLTGQAAAQ